MSQTTLLQTVALILAAGVIITGIIAALDTSDSSEDLRTINVQGQSLRVVQPNEAEIRFSVTTEDESADAASAENAETMQAVIAALEEYGEVQTEGYRVDPVRDYGYFGEQRDLTIQFYRATNTVRLTSTDLESVGDAIDSALEAGANDVSGLNFELSEDAQNELRRELLSEAGENAKQKAESIASGLGLSVGKVQSVSEGSVYFPSNYRYASALMEDAASTPIQAEDLEVRASISVTYIIK